MNTIRTVLTNPVRRTVAMGILSGALIAVYGLYLSRAHITHVGYAMGLNALEAETLFVFIDIIAIYGKMLTSKHLSAKTRRIGYKFLVFGGAASLVCNVASGFMHGSIGAAVYGAFIVALIAALEYGVANTKGKAVRAKDLLTEPELTARQVAARKGAETRRRNAAKPVSPGRVPVDELNASMAA